MKDITSSATPLQKFGDLFIPDVLARRQSATKRVGPTTWLDGLRGWAALSVTWMHLTVYTHEGLELCYGSKFRHSDEYNYSPIALPIIRLPFTGGHFSVMLFFVISGYVVPRRLLQLLQDGQRQTFLEEVHSAMIRRPVRLFLPVLLSTFALLTSWHLFGIRTPWPKQQSNIIFEIWAWLQENALFTFYWRQGWLYSYYNVHSWTIPVEFRGSILLFTFLLIAHNVSTKARVWMTLLMTLHLSIGSAGAWYACFFAGMLMSDLELISQGTQNISFIWDRLDQWLRARKAIRSLVLHLVLLAGLFLATQPSGDWSTRQEILGDCPGWSTLSQLIPKSYVDKDSQFRWFWLFWGAWMGVYAVREIPWLRACFETSFAQYLGKHSFALYLIHGPMIAIFSEKLFYLTGVKQAWNDEQRLAYGSIQNRWRDASWWPFPDTGVYGLEPNFLFCVALSIPLFLYLAEVGTRVFDTPSVHVSKWVWQKWKNL